VPYARDNGIAAGRPASLASRTTSGISRCDGVLASSPSGPVVWPVAVGVLVAVGVRVGDDDDAVWTVGVIVAVGAVDVVRVVVGDGVVAGVGGRVGVDVTVAVGVANAFSRLNRPTAPSFGRAYVCSIVPSGRMTRIASASVSATT
jgi:hypothetical protein